MSEHNAPPMQGGPAGPPPPMQGAAPVAPKKSGPSVKMLLRIGLIVVVVIVAIVGWFLSRDDAVNAKVGDCISGQSANDMKIVACTDASATNKVVGRVEGRSEQEFNTNLEGICEPYPTAESGFWEGKQGRTGVVLCLEPIP